MGNKEEFEGQVDPSRFTGEQLRAIGQALVEMQEALSAFGRRISPILNQVPQITEEQIRVADDLLGVYGQPEWPESASKRSDQDVWESAKRISRRIEPAEYGRIVSWIFTNELAEDECRTLAKQDFLNRKDAGRVFNGYLAPLAIKASAFDKSPRRIREGRIYIKGPNGKPKRIPPEDLSCDELLKVWISEVPDRCKKLLDPAYRKKMEGMNQLADIQRFIWDGEGDKNGDGISLGEGPSDIEQAEANILRSRSDVTSCIGANPRFIKRPDLLISRRYFDESLIADAYRCWDQAVWNKKYGEPYQRIGYLFNPEELLVRQELVSFRKLLMSRHLSNQQFQIVKLVMVGFTPEQIAEELQTTRNVVDVQLSRIREKFPLIYRK